MHNSNVHTKIERLEAIRGFAAIYVVLFHLLPQKIYLFGINVGYLFRFGPEAVIVFFILSGFVIKYSFQRYQDKSFSYYFIRRFVRLYVPLIIVFIVAYILHSIKLGHIADPDWKTLLGNLFMLQDVISQKPNVISASYLGNGVLWSLSYEWWFYMFFYLLMRYIPTKKLYNWVNSIVIVAAISYLFYPFIVNRIIMYFAIWWSGARMADLYIENKSISFKNLQSYLYVLTILIAILGINFLVHIDVSKNYSYPLVAYPFVELRHFLGAFLIVIGSLFWNKIHWIGFKFFIRIFKHLAPMSYVIYISHHHLVIEATYLKFLDNKILEYTLYFLIMIVFSYVVEVLIYERLKKLIIN